MTVIHVKECLRECEKVGSNLFAVEKNTDGACTKEGGCACICYTKNITLNSNCQLKHSTDYDLHRIVDLNEKVRNRIIERFWLYAFRRYRLEDILVNIVDQTMAILLILLWYIP